MGLLDTLREKQEARKQRLAQIGSDRGKELAKLGPLYYSGGFDIDTKTNDSPYKVGSTLAFYENRIEYKTLVIDTALVKHLYIEGKDEVNRRITATRMVALGVFSLAAQKKQHEKEVFITIELSDGRQVLFHDTMHTPSQIRSKLANAVSYYSHRQATAPPPHSA